MKALKGWMMIIVVVPFAGVSQPDKEKLPVVNISGGFANHQKVNLSKIAKSVRYVKLETTPESYISSVSKAIFTDDQIIVLDEQSNNLLRFDNEGRFLGAIGRSGRGPGEYVRVTQVEVNQGNKTIYVFDFAQGKVLKFNLEGKFIGNNENPLLGFWVTLIDEKYLVWFDPSRAYKFVGGYYKTVITDLDGNILQKSSPRKQSKEEKFRSPCSMQSSVYLYQNAAHYWEVTSDSVFRVASDWSFCPSVKIEQGAGSFPKDKMYQADFVMTRFNDYSTIIWLLESDGYYFGKGFSGNHLANILFIKSSGECYNVTNERKYLVNDLDGGPGFWPLGKINDRVLYSAVNLEDTGNPVLMVVEMK